MSKKVTREQRREWAIRRFRRDETCKQIAGDVGYNPKTVGKHTKKFKRNHPEMFGEVSLDQKVKGKSGEIKSDIREAIEALKSQIGENSPLRDWTIKEMKQERIYPEEYFREKGIKTETVSEILNLSRFTFGELKRLEEFRQECKEQEIDPVEELSRQKQFGDKLIEMGRKHEWNHEGLLKNCKRILESQEELKELFKSTNEFKRKKERLEERIDVMEDRLEFREQEIPRKEEELRETREELEETKGKLREVEGEYEEKRKMIEFGKAVFKLIFTDMELGIEAVEALKTVAESYHMKFSPLVNPERQELIGRVRQIARRKIEENLPSPRDIGGTYITRAGLAVRRLKRKWE